MLTFHISLKSLQLSTDAQSESLEKTSLCVMQLHSSK